MLAVFEIEALGVDGGLLLAGQVKGAQVAAGYEPGTGIGVECVVDLVEDAQAVPDLVDGVAYYLGAASDWHFDYAIAVPAAVPGVV